MPNSLPNFNFPTYQYKAFRLFFQLSNTTDENLIQQIIVNTKTC